MNHRYLCFVELWNIFHNELDINRNGRLEIGELDTALRKSSASFLTFHLVIISIISVRYCAFACNTE